MLKNAKNLTDYYSQDPDDSIRGVLLYQNIPQLLSSRIADRDFEVCTPVKKAYGRFPVFSSAPLKPSDPLYVFSKWTLVCRSELVSDLANALLEGVECMFGSKCVVKTNLSKVKISVDIPTNLSITIKFFSVSEDPNLFYVMFRKDSGDWFAFSSFYKSCTKYLNIQ